MQEIDEVRVVTEVAAAATGAAAFVLFTGLSIVPARLTLGDCLTRCVAAVYLRQRSKSFRQWVDRVEGAHNIITELGHKPSFTGGEAADAGEAAGEAEAAK